MKIVDPKPLGAPHDTPAGHVAETSGINLYAEYSLHDLLKRRAAGEGGRIEVGLAGKVVDAVRADGELVEVQTGHLDAAQKKLRVLLNAGYRVRVQFPVEAQRTIVRMDAATGEVLSRRKSPKHGDLWTMFDELVRAPGLIGAQNVVFEVLFVQVTELRAALAQPVRRGRFLRSFARTDKGLDAVLGSREFHCAQDWLDLIPGSLAAPWTSESLGLALGIAAERARKVLYSFSRAGLVECCAIPKSRRKAYRPAV